MTPAARAALRMIADLDARGALRPDLAGVSVRDVDGGVRVEVTVERRRRLVRSWDGPWGATEAQIREWIGPADVVR